VLYHFASLAMLLDLDLNIEWVSVSMNNEFTLTSQSIYRDCIAGVICKEVIMV
jgi:hypothetical protein